MPAGVIAYGAAGLAGTAAHYVALVLLVRLAGAEPVAASTFGAVLGAVVNYWTNHRYAFRSTVPHQRAFPRFIAVSAVGMALNAAVMFATVHLLGVHYVPGQLAATATAFLGTYAMNHRWTF